MKKPPLGGFFRMNHDDMDKIVTAQPVRATRLRYGSSNQANNAPDLAHALSWHPKEIPGSRPG